MAARFLLPVELDVLLSSSSASSIRRPIFRLPSAFPPRRHVAVAVDLSSRPLSSSVLLEHQHPSSIASSLAEAEPIFEDFSTEYRIPPSKISLDPRPKSSSEALLALLLNRQYSEADELLSSLKRTSQSITSRAMFARHAYRLVRKDTNSAWLDWWTVGHPSPPLEFVYWSKETEMARRTTRSICQTLLRRHSNDFERLLDFAVVAVAQGFEKEVADAFLLHFAAYAPLKTSERLWDSMVGLVDRRKSKMWKAEKERMDSRAWFGSAVTTSKSDARQLGELDRQAEHARKDLLQRREFRIHRLRLRRNESIRLLVKFGRLDDAVSLAQSAEERFYPGPLTILSLLSSTAESARYDLFVLAYQLLEKYNFVLRPRVYGVPFNLNRATPADDPSPAPQEAYVAFRYDNFTSPLEEGSLDSPSSIQLHNEAVNTTLLSAVEAGDRQTAASTLLTALQSTKQPSLPSLDATAQFIALLREQGFSQIVDALTKTVRKKMNSFTRGYWASAVMLEHIRSGNFTAAVVELDESSETAGLPQEFREVIRKLSRNPKKVVGGRWIAPRWRPRPKVYLDSHSFSIATEAIVYALAPQPGKGDEIEELYRSLVVNGDNGIALRRSDRSNIIQEDGKHTLGSPLDPYTFLPFLQTFSDSRSRSPVGLLHVLADMTTLNLTIEKEHWGVVLGDFARRGEINDLTFLLHTLGGRDVSTSPSFEVREGMDKVGKLKNKLDIVAYTSVVTGLRLKGEKELAEEIADWVIGEERFRGLLDDKFWSTVQLLGVGKRTTV